MICFSFHCWCVFYSHDVNNLGSLHTILLFYKFDHEVAVQFSCSILSCIEATFNCYHYSSCSCFLAPRFAELLDKFNPLLSLYTLTALHRLNLWPSYRLNCSRYDFRAEVAFCYFFLKFFICKTHNYLHHLQYLLYLEYGTFHPK